MLKIGGYLDYETMKVTEVIKGKLGEKMKIKKDDIIIEMNGKDIKDISDLKLSLFKATYLGEKFSLKVKREGQTVELTTVR